MTIDLVLLTVALSVSYMVKNDVTEHIISDYSPLLFEMLIITKLIHASKSDLVDSNHFELIFGFAMGQFSGLLQMKTDKISQVKYWRVKVLLQTILVVCICIALLLNSIEMSQLFSVIILLLLVALLDFIETFSNQAKQTTEQGSQTSFKQKIQQVFPKVFDHKIEQYFDCWVCNVSRNSKAPGLTITNPNAAMEQYMNDNKMTPVDLLKKIKKIIITGESDIMPNKDCFSIESTLFQQVSTFCDELDVIPMTGQLPRQYTKMLSFQTDQVQQLKVNSPKNKEMRSQNSRPEQFDWDKKCGFTKQFSNLNVSQINNSDKADLTNSLQTLLQVFTGDISLNQQIRNQKRIQLQGVFHFDDNSQIFLKISIIAPQISQNQCTVIVENNHTVFTQFSEAMITKNRLEISQQFVKMQSKLIEQIREMLFNQQGKSKVDSSQSQQLDEQKPILCNQVAALIFYLNIRNYNFMDTFQTLQQKIITLYETNRKIKLEDLLTQLLVKLRQDAGVLTYGITIKLVMKAKDSNIISDNRSLQQLFSNLIFNAIQAFKSKLVTNIIVVTVYDNNPNTLLVEITDSAGGVNRDQLDNSRIFNGKLGIHSVQKNVMLLSCEPLLKFINKFNLHTEIKGTTVRFTLSKQLTFKHIKDDVKLCPFTLENSFDEAEMGSC